MRTTPMLVLAALLAAPACDKNGSNGAQTSASTASATTSSAAASVSTPAPPASSVAMDQGPGRGGFDGMFLRATKELTLTADQQSKVDALKQGLRDRDTGPQNAGKTLRTDLLAMVRAGKIDAAKIKSDETAIDAAMTAMHDKQAKVLDDLHGVLDAGQRKTVADTIRARWAARDKDDAGAGASTSGDAGAQDWAKKRVDRMTTDLALDATQRSQVAAIVAKQNSPATVKAMHDGMKAQMEALATAFQGDAFDGAKALPTSIGGKTPHDMTDRRVSFLMQLAAPLHPDQRDKLATQMELAKPPRGYAPLEDEDALRGADESKSGE